MIWSGRNGLRGNQLVFQQTNVPDMEFFHRIMAMSSQNLLQAPLQTNNNNNVVAQWIMPECGVVSLNTDGVVAPNGTLAFSALLYKFKLPSSIYLFCV
jgi:hypothetical protein